jgi:methionyl-tRNA formyltransferase
VGRKRILSASAVAQRAEQLGIPVIKASQWSAQTAHAIASLGADAAAVVAYGALLPQEALKLLPHGWVNLHFSALPAYRGAAPVQRALMAGETTIYSNTFLIEEGLDTGPVFECDSTPVGDEDTAGSILNRLAETGGELLLRTFARIAEGQTGTPQTGQASYAHKMSIADGRLDFNEPAERVLATFRGVTPEPGAWCELAGNRFKIAALQRGSHETELAPGQIQLRGKKVYVGTGAGELQLVRVQPAGKKVMDAPAWARGVGSDLAEGKVVLA